MPRFGFTTGSCSAAAAKAATYMLLTGKLINKIIIDTPKGIRYDAEILDITRAEKSVSCCVIKDGGDDPDITTGAHVYAEVTFYNRDEKDVSVDGMSFGEIEHILDYAVFIEGGVGVGRVTKPGLDQPVGNAAINSVPRRMITDEVTEVMRLCDYRGGIKVTISIPEGESLAEKTFNPRLGIVGGISVLGTSGIVEPMSSEALLATIDVELNQKKALGWKYVPISPGNYGLDYMKRTYDFDLDVSVKCSNFVGDTIDMVIAKGFSSMLFTGHIGKLVKIAGGMMNTHSKFGDNRMEVLADCLKVVGEAQGIDVSEVIKKVTDCVVTEDAVNILEQAGYRDAVMALVMDRIMSQLEDRAEKILHIECIMYSNSHGLLAKSKRADALLQEIKEQCM